MKAFGLARLGRDAELRVTTSGEPVATLALAFSYGRRGQDGERPTQWVDASLWGKRAQALAPYLKKGSLVMVTLEDVHTEEYSGRNGPGLRLAARVADLEFAGGGERADARKGAAHSTPVAAPAPGFAAPNPGARSAEPSAWPDDEPPF